jgi:uncharacterized phage protein gp47/JayE
LAGADGNVAAAAIDKVTSVLFDSSIVVTNAAQMAGGANIESDDNLRTRVRNFAAVLRRGTLSALEYGAKTVDGVGAATAVEDPTGIVTLYITDTSGGSSPTLVSAVATEIENWRAAGALVNVVGGSLYDPGAVTPITIELVVKTGVDTLAIADNVKAAIVSRISKLGIGETLYRSLIRSAAMSVAPDDIKEVNIINPATDIAPTADQIIRTTVGHITVS